MNVCPYCEVLEHKGVCPRVSAIDYAPDGVTVRRVEFHRQSQAVATGEPIVRVGPRVTTTRPVAARLVSRAKPADEARGGGAAPVSGRAAAAVLRAGRQDRNR